MISIEDVRAYLPKYLSPGAEESLFSELENFPENIDSRLYTSLLKDEETLFQGDGIKDLLVTSLPDTRIGNAPSIILSNTCDIDKNNKRFFTSQMVYAPIFDLEKYKNRLISRGIKSEESVKSHLADIRRQHITQIFFLPKWSELEHDSLVFLDRLSSCSNDFVPVEKLRELRLFTLSQYGHYLFLFKLSVHFTRIAEGVERGFDVPEVPLPS